MRRAVDVYLLQIVSSGSEIVQFTAGKSLNDYLQDRGLQLIVERLFTIMGEATVRLRDHFPETFARLNDASKIIEFRNFLAHRYDIIESAEVWRIVEGYLPATLAQVSTLLAELEGASAGEPS